MQSGQCACRLLLGSLIFLVGLEGISGSTRNRWETRPYTYERDRTDIHGVYNWPRTYREQCGGRHQSPVNIQTNRVVYKPRLPKQPRYTFNSPVVSGNLLNNGHSPQFVLDEGFDVLVSNIPYQKDVFKLHDFHFHHGGRSALGKDHAGRNRRDRSTLSSGSEHFLDGYQYEGEVHFVFFNRKYGSLQQAEDKKDGVVVFAFFVRLQSPKRRPSRRTQRLSRWIKRNIPQVYRINAEVRSQVDLNLFIPGRWDYYTYSGSLTTPSCFQTVQWIVLDQPLIVERDAWNRMAGLQSYGDLADRFGNFRIGQPLNGRIVESNFRIQPTVVKRPDSATPNPYRANPNAIPGRDTRISQGMTSGLSSGATSGVRPVTGSGQRGGAIRGGYRTGGRIAMPGGHTRRVGQVGRGPSSARFRTYGSRRVTGGIRRPLKQISGRKIGVSTKTKIIGIGKPVVKPPSKAISSLAKYVPPISKKPLPLRLPNKVTKQQMYKLM